MSAKPSFFAELKRRNVYKVGAMYAVAGWLLVQIVTQVFPIFHVSELVQRIIVLTIVAGFPLALVLSWIYELTPQGIVKTDEVAPGASITRQTGQRLNHAIIAVLLLAVLVLLGKVLWPHAIGNPTAPQTLAAGDDKSIAVLPFANLSNDPDNAFFATGMQDEILTRLAKIGALRVVSRTSTQRYASAPPGVGEIARQLGVANILEGSVQKAGNAVHINVQLIGAGDRHLWAESYNRKLDDMFGVEGEVAQAVAEALDARLSQAEQEAVTARPTADPEAYQAYLRARTLYSAAYSFVATQQALDYYQEAVRHDPGFALAWAQMAYLMSALYFNGEDPQRSTAEAIKSAAGMALKLQPQSVDALEAHGYYLYRVERDYAGALEDFRLALAKQPNDPLVLQAMYLVERRLGRWDQGFAHMEGSVQRDTHNVGNLSALGCEGYNYVRRFDDARRVLDKALSITPDEPNVLNCLAGIEQSLGQLDAADALLMRARVNLHDVEYLPYIQQLLYRRRYAEVVTLLQKSLPRDDAALSGLDLQNLLVLAYAQKWAGQTDAARDGFKRLIRTVESSPDAMEHTEVVGYQTLGLAYAGLGRRDLALQNAQRGVEHNRGDAIKGAFARIAQAQTLAQLGDADGAMALLPELLRIPAGLNPPLLAFDPIWDPLRQDPRFQKLAATSKP